VGVHEPGQQHASPEIDVAFAARNLARGRDASHALAFDMHVDPAPISEKLGVPQADRPHDFRSSLDQCDIYGL
jgi:hypothetical protein